MLKQAHPFFFFSLVVSLMVFCSNFPMLALILWLALPVFTALFYPNKKSYLKKLFYFTALIIIWLPFNVYPLVLRLLKNIEVSPTVGAILIDNRRLLLVLCGIIFLVIYYFSVKSIFGAVPYLTSDASFKQTLRQSFKITKGHFLKAYLPFLSCGIFLWLLKWFELFTLDHLRSAFSLSLFSTIYVFIEASILVVASDKILKLNSFKWSTLKKIRPWFSLLLFSVMFLGQLYLTADFIQAPFSKRPLIISHRGVDGKNGVQNTIEALEKTHASARPNYVELDLHETLDQRFVVSHDPDLRQLAHKNILIKDYPLDTLTTYKLTENKRQAHLASFDNYLTEAEKLKQPLLIELKVTSEDEAQVTHNFMRLYLKKISDVNEFHSMNLKAIEKLKHSAPKVRAGYILPFAFFSFTKVDVNFYSLDQRTATTDYIKKAHQAGKKVYLWTLETPTQALNAWALGAEGVITDRPSLLKQTLMKAKKVDLLRARAKLYVRQF